MALKRRKANKPFPEQLANADSVGNNDQDDGEKEKTDEDEIVVRLLRSVVHDEYTQSSEKQEIRKGDKKKMWLAGGVMSTWWKMERVKKIEHEDPNSLNNVIDSCEWDDDLKLGKNDFTLIDKLLTSTLTVQANQVQYVLPTVKDVNEHIYLFKSDKLIGKTAKALSKEFESYFR